MRFRIAAAVAIVAAVVAVVGVAKRPTPQILSQAVGEVIIPLTMTDRLAALPLTLQGVSDAYAATWAQAFDVTGFDARVGVAPLASDEGADPFCAGSQSRFDADGWEVRYCRTASAGPDRLPYAGIILIPYPSYKAAMPPNDVGRLGTALLLARVYARHLVTELRAQGLISAEAETVLSRRTDCLAGLSLRSLLLSLDTPAWKGAVTFANRFAIDGKPRNVDDALVVGYRSGKLQSCVG